MTKPILIAGLLGGLLGGVVSFAASRWLVPHIAKPDPATQAPVLNPDARQKADEYVAELRAGKFDEFALHAKLGSTVTTEQEYNAFKSKLLESRTVFFNSLGPSSGEFEFVRETSLSPSLVRYVYLEKFQRGGVLWVFVLYRGPDSHWRLAWVDYGGQLGSIFAGLS